MKPITVAARERSLPFDLVASELGSLDSPDEAIFYTSGRTSNEAAFAYQLMARAFGTNNLPDCSNMCHEPTSVALQEAIGIGKGTVTFDDFDKTDLVIVVGQNPGTNHPRMLTTLEEVKRRGAHIIAVNPLPEAGLIRFKNPQRLRGLVGHGTKLADLHLPVRLGGDQALFRWLSRRVLEENRVDTAFVETHTEGFEAVRAALMQDPADLSVDIGVSTTELDAIQQQFGFDPPRANGFDTVASLEALRDGKASVVVSLGGNLARSLPDSALAERALRSCRLTVHISTKLNRTHLVPGDVSLILPSLGRTEVDAQISGPQFVTIEDSFGTVHRSVGKLDPPSQEVRSEVAIVAGIAARLVPDCGVPWKAYADDYRAIRADVTAIVPGFRRFEERVLEPGGFLLPHPPRDRREFPTPSGKAQFSVELLHTPYGRTGGLVLQTLRSHDQFNTTIYGLDDRSSESGTPSYKSIPVTLHATG
jgi:anaerobic selenocysteine-containing dehydrogenase